MEIGKNGRGVTLDMEVSFFFWFLKQ
jgi:hypothetical protein